MSGLKLAGLPDDTPVKMTVELPADVHRDLVHYSVLMSEAEGRAFSPSQLVAPMLARFMATDRSFSRQR